MRMIYLFNIQRQLEILGLRIVCQRHRCFNHTTIKSLLRRRTNNKS